MDEDSCNVVFTIVSTLFVTDLNFHVSSITAQLKKFAYLMGQIQHGLEIIYEFIERYYTISAIRFNRHIII